MTNLPPGSRRSERGGATPLLAPEFDRDHPGFYEAHQAATLTVGFRLMRECAQVIVARDERDDRRRSWEYTDTYEAVGDGTYRLIDVEVTPETDDDDVEFYECLRSNRLAAGITIKGTPEMSLPHTFSIYDAGRMSANAPKTAASLERGIAALTEQLAAMDPNDPVRVGVEGELALLRCYQEHGTSRDQRLACLTMAADYEPSPPN